MHDAAVEQIGDGGQANMRMRADVHALAGDELHRPEMIEEDEGPDHLALAVRQRAPHFKSIAEVAGARHDHQFQRVAGMRVAEDRIVGGNPAHDVSVEFREIIAALVGPLQRQCSSSRSACDEAIQTFCVAPGLLRGARNDAVRSVRNGAPWLCGLSTSVRLLPFTAA
jgi:hypothetical protein